MWAIKRRVPRLFSDSCLHQQKGRGSACSNPPFSRCCKTSLYSHPEREREDVEDAESLLPDPSGPRTPILPSIRREKLIDFVRLAYQCVILYFSAIYTPSYSITLYSYI